MINKYIFYLPLLVVIISALFLITPIQHKLSERNADFVWSSNISKDVQFLDYSFVESTSDVCRLDSRGFAIRECCARFDVYKNNIWVDKIPSMNGSVLGDLSIDYLHKSFKDDFGVFSVNFVESSNFKDNDCLNVDSLISFNSYPILIMSPAFRENITLGELLDFNVNIVNNWSYTVQGMLNVDYNGVSVNRSIDVPIGRSFQAFSIDLGNFTGTLDVNIVLDTFLNESNFKGVTVKDNSLTSISTSFKVNVN